MWCRRQAAAPAPRQQCCDHIGEHGMRLLSLFPCSAFVGVGVGDVRMRLGYLSCAEQVDCKPSMEAFKSARDSLCKTIFLRCLPYLTMRDDFYY